jgi:hypothetical protein
MANNKKGGEVVTLPPGWVDHFNIPKAVFDRMTYDEVEALAADLSRQVEALRKWNDQRGEWTPVPDFYEGVPLPKSYEEYNWNVKTFRNGRWVRD